MAYNSNSLRLIESFGSVGDSNGLYAYATNDTKAQIQTAGYFNNAAKLLEVGDIIVVSGDLDGTPFHTSYTVSSISGAGAVALTEHAAVTQNVIQEIPMSRISTKASDAEVFRFVANFAGSITRLRSVLNNALATGNATIQAAINGVNVTGGLLTLVQAGSAAGNVASATPTAANTFVAGDVITLTVAGASTATGTVNVSAQLTPS